MAAAQVATQPPMPQPGFKPIIDYAAANKDQAVTVQFDPKKHLAYKEPENILTMRDIGYPEDTGVSHVAMTEPFQLFSPEAIRTMRNEIFREEVMNNCLYESNLAACQVRGYASKYAPFIYDAWHSPKTLELISKLAGVDLVPAINFDIGHINVSVKSQQETRAEVDAIEREKRSYAEDEGIAGCPWEDDKPVVGWHVDSYPFVCVLMLSDCTNMVGGETAIRTGDGDVMKVRGPQVGCAVVLQGRYITHQALRALGAQERITMVTSFRPKSAHLRDDTVLSTIRPISDISQIYYEFSKYRLENLEERIRSQLKKLQEANAAGKKTDTKALKAFLKEQEEFIAHTNAELVPDDEVKKGCMPEMDIPDTKMPTPPAEDGDRPAKKQKRKTSS
ncbi:hypothetical protein K431DRAFT_317575 [Polychaeton citri CBS 116435]|uniref:Fe2OG dioxygenase domain-containing protein n=1 Tax=Polychaeton citri CBS 116435 TaxID=1314669 RepID=A0A9P4QHD9_9PEZI|nr:hypothetical protein K431DRAFT_317575 [Polychaeton citri CBS 116435]